MGVEKKLKQYVMDDRPAKLKSYAESHNVDVINVTLGRGRGLLHYCARYGSSAMLRCLLKLDCVPDQLDRSGNLPLHLAALRALEEDLATAKETFDGMVIPLLKAYPLGQDMEDCHGVTGHDLVAAVKDKVKASSTPQQEEKRQEEEDEMWRKKLNEEAMFEFEEQNPRYHTEEDFSQERSTESYEDWAERMRHEMSARWQKQSHQFTRDKKHKRRHSRRDKSEESGAKKSKEEGEGEGEQERLNRAREEMRKRYKPPPHVPNTDKLVEKKKRYESKFSHLLNHLTTGRTLTYGCVPWPHLSLDSVAETLFCDMPDKKSPVYRKYLRSQQVRWHPDKFMQKFGDHLHPDHVPKIMNRVKAISQVLNKLSSE
ncbi:NF-kappa-B inhibitor-like protein 1 [Aplysia californica]|uniref:NF-kappa-B inhibitor-like protein 1 n=1 Tax=Aplysia californica TaxID=6500 RepID=A0ABM0K6F4_APLCA|nr:NF-kappa-B inhibitor-like protein 1 [Aplysia californica]XP_005109842.1 NF-kappa-B inhibitor-like protein 1 [Aplysia californica]XP_005109843.1 NF-kappa-B inhibitor-like protein 1 [Aplysia californica]XP_005109844.1 NF-kappa-B inhibitor-like protein 1 [Aplysia californica]